MIFSSIKYRVLWACSVMFFYSLIPVLFLARIMNVSGVDWFLFELFHQMEYFSDKIEEIEDKNLNEKQQS